MRADGNSPDILLATGDISTHGSRRALGIAREFIEEVDIFRGKPKRLTVHGLGFTSDNRLVLPGNHDRYNGGFLPFQKRSNSLEKVFGCPETYPYVRGYRKVGNSSGPTILFFVFDSTANDRLRRGTFFWNLPAQGLIENAECRWLASEVQRIERERKVLHIDGVQEIDVDLQNSVRVAVLHHHPIDADPSKRSLGKKETWTMLQNNSNFVDACFDAGINLVLFGHQHEFYSDSRVRLISTSNGQEYRRVSFVCCPSASEYSETDNGFLYFEFYPSHCVLYRYTWTLTGFTPLEPMIIDFSHGISSGAVS